MKTNELLNPDEALQIIIDSVPLTDAERICLNEAFGRVLAEDVCTEEDLPPFDNSAMDGYAVIAEDCAAATPEAPRRLKVVAEQPAGSVTSQVVMPGTAVRIMTGALMPAGADTVVMVEDTRSGNGTTVDILKPVSRGANVRLAGEDVRRGMPVLKAGTQVGAAEMGMLAALGRSEILAAKRPRVAVITTGNEIVGVDERPASGQIRDSNRYSIMGQVYSCGAEVSMLGRVTDERGELEEVMDHAAEVSDVIITSGGVSVGEYDFVKQTLSRLGQMRFWKVAIKPGKPLAYGHIKGKPVFGLPGNPVSSMVTFDVFVRHALLRMAGIEKPSFGIVQASAASSLRHREGRREFVRARTVWEEGRYVAVPTGDQSSHRLSSMLGANSYIVISETSGNVEAGQTVQVMMMR